MGKVPALKWWPRAWLALALVFTLGPAKREPPRAPAAPVTGCEATGTKLPVGTVVGPSTLATVDFVSASTGVALTAPSVTCPEKYGGSRSAAFPVRLVGTADAGHTWRVEGTAPPLAGSGPPYVQLAFATSRLGWADFGYGLSFTANGGRTWQRVDLGGKLVADLAYTGGKAVVVTWEDWQVWGAGRDDHWHLLRPPPAQRGSLEGASVALGPRAGDLVIVTNRGSWPHQRSTLAETTDGGEHWAVGRNPCAPPKWLGAGPLAQSPGGELGVICGGLGGAGSTAHGLYVSDDRGRHWSARAIDDLVHSGAAYFPAQDSPEAFAMPTADRFYVATENFFSESTDGGRAWRPAADQAYGPGNLVAGTQGPTIDFVSARDGWALWDGLKRTTTGVVWAKA
jgi:hypothetical protein